VFDGNIYVNFNISRHNGMDSIKLLLVQFGLQVGAVFSDTKMHFLSSWFRAS